MAAMQLLLFLLFIAFFEVEAETNPLVVSPAGSVRGYFATSVKGRKYAAFEGIPYALPPIGKYRFREPQPMKAWRGVWDANYTHVCLQYNHYTEPGNDFVQGNEDCLYLNIYSTNWAPGANLDVIVFIHGGAFMFGSQNVYGPKIILSEDIVYVTLNYRLGPLGFASTGDNIMPGNNGMKDQVLALKWIKANIEYFGGNPNSITLTGMSAGGASVHFHLLSPLSKGLFHRAMSISGSALNPWALTENALLKTKQLAASMGCAGQTSKEIMDCLRFRPGRQMISKVSQFFPFMYNPFSPFGVVVEPVGPNAFLPDHPYNLLKTKQVTDVPWMLSFTNAEGLYPGSDFVGYDKLDEINSKWEEYAPFILDYNHTVDPIQRAEVARTVKQFYLQNEPISRNTFPLLINMLSDRLFLSEWFTTASLHSSAIQSSVYLYYFSYRGAHSKSELRAKSNTDYGASHGDDLTYVLSTNVNTQETPQDRQMSDLLVKMWTSFARTGQPAIGTAQWTPYPKTATGGNLEYLHIVSPANMSMEISKDIGNSQFWKTLNIKENAYLFPGRDEL